MKTMQEYNNHCQLLKIFSKTLQVVLHNYAVGITFWLIQKLMIYKR